MNESMSQVLKHLGVPFFGTHAALILPDHDGNGDQNEKKDEQIVDAQGERPKWSPRVTAKELMELKRKMVGYLEDMYKAWWVISLTWKELEDRLSGKKKHCSGGSGEKYNEDYGYNFALIEDW